MDIDQEMLTPFNDDSDLLKKFETYVHGYDIDTKAQLSQWKRPEDRQMWRFCSLFSSNTMA